MNELPKRKQLRLKNYDYSQCGYYFITICTYKRCILFHTNVGATPCGRPNVPYTAETPDKMIEKWLFKLEDRFDNIKIREYVIMPDHIHFIISKTDEHVTEPLQNIIGWFKTMTTNEYIKNVKHHIFPPFNKKVWQRNYYEHIIRDEHDYIRAAEYILNNPFNPD